MDNFNLQKEKAIIHKNNSLERLNISFLKHINSMEFKKSHLLAYWINDFSNYHDEERNFDTTKLITFKRGSIIKVNLGFNIGNELGGLHYCIVLNKFDNPKNGTLNIIPLTSKKNKKYPKTSIDLGNEIYNALNNLYSKQFENFSFNIKNNLDSSEKNLYSIFEYSQKIKKEISKMKKGSIALINQITTISKQRIYDDDILKHIRLSEKSLNLIDENIIKFFTK